jgi:hypothetical protein
MVGSLHIPLSSAYLCQDCNCVSNCSRTCPACASEVLMGLAGVLNRETCQEENAVLLGAIPDATGYPN